MDADRSSFVVDALPRPLRARLVRAQTWLFDLDEATLSPPRRALLFAVRFGWLVTRAFFRDRLQIRAASLSFSTLLALVPAVALAFALAQATGLFATLRDDTILPFVEETLPSTDIDAPGVAMLRETILGLLALVERTSLAGLGVTGLVVLVLAMWRVVGGVDEAFRHVFEQRGPDRPVAQRMRAVLVVMFVTPIGLSYAVMSASLSHGGAAALIASYLPVPWVSDALLVVLPPLVVTLTLFVLYMELPDTSVRARSAFFGAVIAGLAWYGTQLLHVRFQVGLARWNAIYSGFGAFPVLLAMVQISWVIVLLGAQLVALHQHSPSLRVLAAGLRRDFATLSALGMEAAVALAGRDKPILARELASEIRADLITLRHVLEALETRGIVSTITTRAGKQYLLAADPSALRTSDVLDAIERDPHADLPWKDASPAVREALALHRGAGDASEHNVTIAALRARGRKDTATRGG